MKPSPLSSLWTYPSPPKVSSHLWLLLLFCVCWMGGDGEEDKNYEQNTNPLTVPSTWSKSILFLLQLICKPRYFQGQLKFYFPRKFWFSVWNSPFITLFSGGTSGKKPACQCRRHMRQGLDTWVGKIPWRRAWKLTPVFLPREFQGQRSLVDYSPQGCKESDTTEATQHKYMSLNHTHTVTHINSIHSTST